ncbi:hypothetical protein ATG_10180 [Desulfurococcaceae archaeon AG1]|jgi:hypothetical protein|nr:hypothetical protein ATG_10180 [Desulfurococcaceae archaeon AG1]
MEGEGTRIPGSSLENPIFVVERIVWLIESGQSVEETEIRRAGELLGTPVKRVEALRARYSDVFSRFIEKRCSETGSEYRVCIYSWNRKRAFKAFPASLYATGTIIMFRGDEPLEVMCNPLPKALDYPVAAEHIPGSTIPYYVSERIDGWQVNAYYDKILGRWIFSTKYVLHNMYFSRGVLNIDRYGEISNPIVSLADEIASRENLYARLGGLEGWSFIFVLLGPEPAITSPPYPIAPDPKEYKLYLVAARRSDGVLVTGTEAGERIGWSLTPPERIAKTLEDLYSEIRGSIATRSLIAWLKNDRGDPVILEIPSQYYYDAMMVKHLRDAKSASILCSEDLCEEISKLVPEDLGERVKAIGRIYRDLVEALEHGLLDEKAFSAIADTINEIRGERVITVREILDEALSRNYRRLARKILALALEDKSLASSEVMDIIARIGSIAMPSTTSDRSLKSVEG